jgi:hypothetical protein
MKTAVSIPDDVFEEAERLVAELQTSRTPDRLTEAMNRVVDEVGTEVDEFSQRAARRVLKQVDW